MASVAAPVRNACRGHRCRQRGRAGDAGQRRHPAPLLPGLVVQAADAISDQLGWCHRGSIPGHPFGIPPDPSRVPHDPAAVVEERPRGCTRPAATVPVPPLTEARPDMTVVKAYAVQRRLALLQADGEGEIVGYSSA